MLNWVRSDAFVAIHSKRAEYRYFYQCLTDQNTFSHSFGAIMPPLCAVFFRKGMRTSSIRRRKLLWIIGSALCIVFVRWDDHNLCWNVFLYSMYAIFWRLQNVQVQGEQTLTTETGRKSLLLAVQSCTPAEICQQNTSRMNRFVRTRKSKGSCWVNQSVISDGSCP